jgi:Na+/H+ antiporter NhaD/arsenite permease-like protein
MRRGLLAALIGAIACAAPVSAAAAVGPTPYTFLGAPAVFFVFGLILVSIAVWHRYAMAVSLVGLVLIACYRATIDGVGFIEVARHLAGEWVTLANLLLLLLGFEILANHFERSKLPDRLPHLLPGDWTGGLLLLLAVFLTSGLLDNIAAAVLGGVVARHLYGSRVSIGFLAAIVASANAGGAGSVIGDTTTTLMWLHGVSPLTVLPAYLAAGVAFLVLGLAGALSQHRFQPIQGREAPILAMEPRRLAIMGFILASAVTANIVANALSQGEESAPWLGLALWVAILVSAPFAKPDWSVLGHAAKGAVFLVALVAAASVLPVEALPEPSWGSTFALGALSSVFDNIPLTAMALNQGGYDWALLAFAVGYGGSMVWFGSSAGVALTNLYPEGRALGAWLRQGWFVPLGYVAGFFVTLLALGWNGHAPG